MSCSIIGTVAVFLLLLGLVYLAAYAAGRADRHAIDKQLRKDRSHVRHGHAH